MRLFAMRAPILPNPTKPIFNDLPVVAELDMHLKNDFAEIAFDFRACEFHIVIIVENCLYAMFDKCSFDLNSFHTVYKQIIKSYKIRSNLQKFSSTNFELQK